jgi:hypothetical protein
MEREWAIGVSANPAASFGWHNAQVVHTPQAGNKSHSARTYRKTEANKRHRESTKISCRQDAAGIY